MVQKQLGEVVDSIGIVFATLIALAASLFVWFWGNFNNNTSIPSPISIAGIVLVWIIYYSSIKGGRKK